MTLRDAACEYMVRGWHIFPVNPLQKTPAAVFVPQGHREASSYPPDALYWWGRSPDCNIGLSCRKSELVVIDIDPRNGGNESFWELEKALSELPDTLSAETATGGQHLFFKHPGCEFKKEIAPGVDIKDNGYVLLAPSRRYMGSYTWENDKEPAELPDDWIERAIRTEVFNAPRARSQHPLMSIPAEDYIEILTGRQASGRWVQCPFHKNGEERTASLKVQDSMWCCFVCEPWSGKQHAGGNVLDFCAKLWGYPLPLAGADLMECKARAERELGAANQSP